MGRVGKGVAMGLNVIGEVKTVEGGKGTFGVSDGFGVAYLANVRWLYSSLIL